MLMVMSILASGKMIKQMAMEFLLILIMLSMRDTGMKINNTGKELKPGVKLIQMALLMLLILAIFIKAKKMGRADFNGRMVHIMKEILLMVISKDLVDTTLLILINIMRENLECLTWKVEVWRHGQMADDMKEILKMVKRMEKELLNGQII